MIIIDWGLLSVIEYDIYLNHAADKWWKNTFSILTTVKIARAFANVRPIFSMFANWKAGEKN